MSRAWQAERAAEREQAHLDRLRAEGRISDAEYNAECRNIARELRAAYEEDRLDALRAVDDEWGL
jgi:hypothetical protein